MPVEVTGFCYCPFSGKSIDTGKSDTGWWQLPQIRWVEENHLEYSLLVVSLSQCENCFTSSQSCHSWFRLRKFTFLCWSWLFFPCTVTVGQNQTWTSALWNKAQYEPLTQARAFTTERNTSSVRKRTDLVQCRIIQKCVTKRMCYATWRDFWKCYEMLNASFCVNLLLLFCDTK